MGHSSGGGPLCLRIDPEEGRHALVLGETGMGKSHLLVRLALQACRLGTVIVFDPVGDTARHLASSLPEGMADRVQVVSCADAPVPMNALAAATQRGSGPERGVSDLVDALRRVRSARYAESAYWGPRIEETSRRALLAAAAWPDGSLLTAQRLLEGAARAPGAVPPGAAGAVHALRERALSHPEETEGTRRLLSETNADSVLRRMLSGASSWSTAQLFEPGRVSLLSGDAATVGESCGRTLLAVYLALVWLELLRRPDRGKVFLFLDEAQWFAHESAAEILRLGRRFNVHLVLVTQALRSLPESLREATLTNSADFLLFRGSPDEAREFGRWGSEISAERILELDRGEAVALIGKGREVARIHTAPVPPRSPARWLAACERMNRLYPPSNGEPSVGSTGASTAPSAAGSGRWSALLGALASVARADGIDGQLRLSLARFRHNLALDDAAVREVGRLLSRLGALRSEHCAPEGTVWCLSVSVLKLPEPAPRTADSARLEGLARAIRSALLPPSARNEL